MRYRKLDAQGDYVFGGQQNDFLRDTPLAVGQAVKTRLALWRGEWFLDVREGMPWREEVLGERRTPTHDAAIRQRILATPGVTEIAGYESRLDPESRRLSVRATLNTLYGSAQLEAIL
ncbi:hypothetical protein CEG14_15540 [Bordetella genomosp. 1]|uniref:Bacteriophage protein n=1 Tax=Bordetella genomosp. 1 TaxID=1395607 RepID=A0A261SHZ2_9BORD|nr:hypothetical protein [Bordetella genomosp. 1]MDQ8034973.1 hypothetical protein [Bordetella sp.]OZI36410.1 hypothetical protein CEG14_15540 [Bordetella genomosp. 1]OZI57867.1 hypothetical protein CAL27_20930 [Bordetella genomosp. 1]